MFGHAIHAMNAKDFIPLTLPVVLCCKMISSQEKILQQDQLSTSDRPTIFTHYSPT